MNFDNFFVGRVEDKVTLYFCPHSYKVFKDKSFEKFRVVIHCYIFNEVATFCCECKRETEKCFKEKYRVR